MKRIEKSVLSTRALALIAVVFFIPAIAVSLLAGDSEVARYWSEVSGIVFHVAMIFIVARVDAPLWAKASGFSWLALDVLCGVLFLSAVPYDIAWPVRLAGHVLAGLWFIGSSLYSGSRSIAITGVFCGAWLIFYTLASPFLGVLWLIPNTPLTAAWLILVAVLYDRQRPAAWRTQLV